MPIKAYYLLSLFILVSVVAGLVAWRVVAPGARWGWVLPVLLAVLSLYGVGHLIGLSVGPTVTLWGFEVSIAFDIALAFVAAFVGAGLQRAALAVLAG
jgi:hypothetical protein